MYTLILRNGLLGSIRIRTIHTSSIMISNISGCKEQTTNMYGRIQISVKSQVFEEEYGNLIFCYKFLYMRIQ